jgi:dihydroorotase
MPFSDAPHEVLLREGRVIDPSQGLDQVQDVRFLNGVVAEIGLNLNAGVGADVLNVTGMIVTPGLIDLHTHVYWGGTSIGVDPIALARQSATATLVDAGTSGAGNLLGFRKHVIEPSAPLRILPLLNISFPGIFAFSRTVRMGECEDLRLLDMNSCISVAREHADLVVGIKVRVGRGSSGTRVIAPLDMAIEVAETLGLPVIPDGHRHFVQRQPRDAAVGRAQCGHERAARCRVVGGPRAPVQDHAHQLPNRD